jgi:RNA polymerase sigma factor (sigma-70 family)
MQQPKKSIDVKMQIDNVDPVISSTAVKNEFQVWDAFRNGDESAFIQIYKQYYPILISFGLQFCQYKIDVEDFVQDLFIDLRLKRAKLPRLKNSLKVFLMVSLKNRIIDCKRKLNVKLKGLSDYHQEFQFAMPVDEERIKTQEYDEKIQKLKSALSALSTRQREAIYYLYFENLSYSEITVLMSLNHVKSARNIVYKAFNIVKESFLLAYLPLFLRLFI